MTGASQAAAEALGLADRLAGYAARLAVEGNHAVIDCLSDADSSFEALSGLEQEARDHGLLQHQHAFAACRALALDRSGQRALALEQFLQTVPSALQLGQRHLIAQELATAPDLLEAVFMSLDSEPLLLDLALSVGALHNAYQLFMRIVGCGEGPALAVLEAASQRLAPNEARVVAQRGARMKSTLVRRRAAEVMAGTGRRTSPFPELTPREAEVLRLIATGLRNQEIAEQLVLETGTVKTYVNRIFTKLGFADRVQATLYYHRAVDENATR